MYRGELFNSISHLLAAVLALVGTTVLVTLAAVEGDMVKTISYTVYSISLFLLYLSSTLFHSLKGKAKDIFQKIDHLSIYLLIAGTYTPFTLVAIEGSTGWWLFAVIWSLAGLGICFETSSTKGPRVIPVIIYLAMGWACVFTFDQLIAGMSELAFNLLVAGGIVYTLGVVFYVMDKWYPWCHEAWHVFVIGGSCCHYFAIFLL